MFLTIAKDINEKSYLLDCRGIEKKYIQVIFLSNKENIFPNSQFLSKKETSYNQIYYLCKTKKTKIMLNDNKNLNRIKVVLAEKNLQNKWLAEQLGRDQATISKWCNNVAQPPLETLMKIAQILEVNLNDLVRFEALHTPDSIVLKND